MPYRIFVPFLCCLFGWGTLNSPRGEPMCRLSFCWISLKM